MNIAKSYAITDARIQFVSLVDKAANKKRFLITKAADGKATFSTYGRIVKKDVTNHYITGIVYEPLVEDAHGNYMTEEEITKAAYWFAKNGDNVDIQHSFEPLDNAAVVENWVAKADFKIGDEAITKGTWLMTVEVTDDEVWDAVQKGEITGFSMGGLGQYSEEDVDLDTIEKSTSATGKTGADDNNEKRGIFKKLAAALGFDVVEKGAMADTYAEHSKASNFWNAFYALEDLLYSYNSYTDKREFENDENTIRETLTEFNSIVQDILLNEKSIVKALTTDKPVIKAGKKMSSTNRAKLKGICDELSTFAAEFDDEEEEKEETEVKKSEIETMIASAVEKAVAKASETTPTPQVAGNQPAAPATTPAAPEAVTPEAIEKMVTEAISKALEPKEDALTTEAVQEMVSEAVTKAIEPIAKSRGIPSNLNDENDTVQKSGDHFLKGIL